MYAMADTTALVDQGVLSQDQADQIEKASRTAMVHMAINAILCFGILAVTGGLIFWLGTPMSVAVAGFGFAAAGYFLLSRYGECVAMFGNAASLVGAGLLIGGASVEILSRLETGAAPTLFAAGAAMIAVLLWFRRKRQHLAHFIFGAILAMAVAMHLLGLGNALMFYEVTGLPVILGLGYMALALIALGWYIDVRLITAIAIIPLAQMIGTGTFYQPALYAFYSPETTLTIVQMACLATLCLWLTWRHPGRMARHALILALMAFVVANLSALVGSLFGDVVGETLWGPRPNNAGQTDWQALSDERKTFRETALVISSGVYSVLWAVALAALVVWAAMTHRRGLFNAAVTFGAIHGYTQLFESFGDEPLTYVIGGLSANALAWAVWRGNAWLSTDTDRTQTYRKRSMNAFSVAASASDRRATFERNSVA